MRTVGGEADGIDPLEPTEGALAAPPAPLPPSNRNPDTRSRDAGGCAMRPPAPRCCANACRRRSSSYRRAAVAAARSRRAFSAAMVAARWRAALSASADLARVPLATRSCAGAVVLCGDGNGVAATRRSWTDWWWSVVGGRWEPPPESALAPPPELVRPADVLRRCTHRDGWGDDEPWPCCPVDADTDRAGLATTTGGTAARKDWEGDDDPPGEGLLKWA